MKVSNVYIGGWFQRTMLQLSEIYDFLRECKTQLNLDQDKLNEYHKNLEIGKIDYGVSGEEYIEFTTALNIKVKMHMNWYYFIMFILIVKIIKKNTR